MSRQRYKYTLACEQCKSCMAQGCHNDEFFGFRMLCSISCDGSSFLIHDSLKAGLWDSGYQEFHLGYQDNQKFLPFYDLSMVRCGVAHTSLSNYKHSCISLAASFSFFLIDLKKAPGSSVFASVFRIPVFSTSMICYEASNPYRTRHPFIEYGHKPTLTMIGSCRVNTLTSCTFFVRSSYVCHR